MNTSERAQVNRLLGENGLGQLDDPGLPPQIAHKVRDHVHLRSLLLACDPLLRAQMYEALRPNLRFTPKPLDVYIAEAGDIADREQQMRWTGERFEPYLMAEVNTVEQQAVQKLVEQAVAKECLTVTCRRCTRTESFYGTDKWEAVMAAREAGWIYSLDRQVEYCPDYPACGK